MITLENADVKDDYDESCSHSSMIPICFKLFTCIHSTDTARPTFINMCAPWLVVQIGIGVSW